MKKIVLRILSLGLASVLALSMTACSGDNNSSASSAAASSSASSAATNSSASSAAASSSAVESDSSEASAGALPGKFATIEEFVNSDIMQEQIDSITSSLKDSGMNIKITGEGDKLVYTYTYETDTTDIEGLAEMLESGMEDQTSVFEGVAASVKLAVDVESPVVVVRYLDSEGNEIYSREFTAAQ